MLRAWLWYLAALGLSAGALWVFGEWQNPVPARQVADLSTARQGSIQDLQLNTDWSRQVKFFSDAYSQPESPDWQNSPAAQKPPEDILRVQQQTRLEGWVVMIVDGPDDPASTQHRLLVNAPPLFYKLDTPVINARLGPFLRSRARASFEFDHKGSWFFDMGHYSLAEARSVSLADLQPERASRIDLNVVEGGRAELRSSSVPISVHLEPFDLRDSSWEQHKAAAQAADIRSGMVQGSLSFNQQQAVRTVRMTPAGRYTAAIVTADQDVKSHIMCTRSDTAAVVGAYADGVPMMAVAANDWASLDIRVGVYDYGQAVNYRIVALSGNNVTTKELLLWFIGHDLTDKSVEDRVLSLPEIDRRARWLLKALGVHFTDKEVQAASDPDVKSLLKHLQALEG